MALSKVKEFYVRNKMVIDFSIITLLFVLNCFYYQFSILAFSFIFVLCVFSPLDKALSYVVFAIPFAFLHKWDLVGIGIVIALVIIKAYVQIYIVEKQKINKPLLISLAVLIIYILLPYHAINLILLVKLFMIVLLMLIINLALSFPDKVKLSTQVRVLACSLVVSSLVLLCTYFTSPYIKENIYFYIVNEQFIRYSIFCNQPNILALICEIALSINIYYIIRNNGNKKDLFAFAVLSIVGLSTFSKTFLIIYAVMIIFIIIYGLRKNTKITLITCGVMCLILLLLFLIKSDFFISYINRFFSFGESKNFTEAMDYLTTDRYSRWVDYLGEFVKTPINVLFGAGLGCPAVGNLTVHNMFIAILYQLGLIGSAILATTITLLIMSIIKRTNLKFNYAILLPAIVTIMIALVEDLVFYIPVNFIFG